MFRITLALLYTHWTIGKWMKGSSSQMDIVLQSTQGDWPNHLILNSSMEVTKKRTP